MNKTYKILLAILLLTVQVTLLMAQPGGPGPGPGGGDPPVGGGGAGIPLDGGAIELLFAGLVFLGFKKGNSFLSRKKKS